MSGDDFVQIIVGQKFAKGIACCGKPGRHPDAAAREVLNHFAERTVFAANDSHIATGKFVEPEGILGPVGHVALHEKFRSNLAQNLFRRIDLHQGAPGGKPAKLGYGTGRKRKIGDTVMPDLDMKSLKDRIASTAAFDAAALGEAIVVLKPVFSQAELTVESEGDMTAAALHLVDQCIPGWTISLTGKAVEPDGHWRCTLREGTTRDNDEYIGTGRGPTAAQAIATALIHVAELKS